MKTNCLAQRLATVNPSNAYWYKIREERIVDELQECSDANTRVQQGQFRQQHVKCLAISHGGRLGSCPGVPSGTRALFSGSFCSAILGKQDFLLVISEPKFLNGKQHPSHALRFHWQNGPLWLFFAQSMSLTSPLFLIFIDFTVEVYRENRPFIKKHWGNWPTPFFCCCLGEFLFLTLCQIKF